MAEQVQAVAGQATSGQAEANGNKASTSVGNAERFGWILAGFLFGLFAPLIAAIVHHGRPTRKSAVASAFIGIGSCVLAFVLVAFGGFAACCM